MTKLVTEAEFASLAAQLQAGRLASTCPGAEGASDEESLRQFLQEAPLDLGVIRLCETPLNPADMRDLAQDLSDLTDIGTVLIHSPWVTIGVSDQLSRAQVEVGERSVGPEQSVDLATRTFLDASSSFQPAWAFVAALIVTFLFLATFLALRTFLRSREH